MLDRLAPQLALVVGNTSHFVRTAVKRHAYTTVEGVADAVLDLVEAVFRAEPVLVQERPGRRERQLP